MRPQPEKTISFPMKSDDSSGERSTKTKDVAMESGQSNYESILKTVPAGQREEDKGGGRGGL